MARIIETNEVSPSVERDGIVEVASVASQPVPNNVVTLSSGVRVQFLGTLPPTISQQIVVTTFQNANLDANGGVKQNMTSMEQLRLANQMFDYNRSILSFALARKLIKLYDGLPADADWLELLKVNPQIRQAMPDLNFSNRFHQELLYMLYYAFMNEDDIALISEKLLNR